MSQSNIHYTTFDTTQVCKVKAEKNTFDQADPTLPPKADGTPGTKTITFFKIPFKYKVPTRDLEGRQLVGPDGRSLYTVDDLYIEGPEVECRGGIQTKNQGKGNIHQMMVSYDLTKPEYQSWCGRDVSVKEILSTINNSTPPEVIGEKVKPLSCLERVRVAAIQLVKACSEECGVKGSLYDIGIHTSRPVAWKESEDSDGNPIEGKRPAHYGVLICRGRGYGAVKSIFTIPTVNPKDAVPIEWDDDPKVPSQLRGVKIRYIPTWHLSHVSVLANGAVSIKMYLASAVVTAVEKFSLESTQGATMIALAKDTSLMEKLSGQMAALKAQMESAKASMGSTAHVLEDKKEEEKKVETASAAPISVATTSTVPVIFGGATMQVAEGTYTPSGYGSGLQNMLSGGVGGLPPTSGFPSVKFA
jgi:hypothetical protein